MGRVRAGLYFTPATDRIEPSRPGWPPGSSASQAEADASRDHVVLYGGSSSRRRASDAAAAIPPARPGQDRGGTLRLLRRYRRRITAYAASAPAMSDRLEALEKEYGAIANAPAPAQWNAQRKLLRALDASGAGAAVRY